MQVFKAELLLTPIMIRKLLVINLSLFCGYFHLLKYSKGIVPAHYKIDPCLIPKYIFFLLQSPKHSDLLLFFMQPELKLKSPALDTF
jgi:hypothetical protein